MPYFYQLKKQFLITSDLVGIVDNTGRYLAHTKTPVNDHKRLGETDDSLEIALLEAMQEKPFGTIFGQEHPPDRVSGFYNLKYAPGSNVLFAADKNVLAPIMRFRSYYFAAGSLCILFILLLIRLVVGSTTRTIIDLSGTADKVARGAYGDPLSVKSGDEIGR